MEITLDYCFNRKKTGYLTIRARGASLIDDMPLREQQIRELV